MSQDLKEVGNLFKDKREEVNLSLKEVQNATSIRISYLKAIENGEANKLISPVYAQGFFKQYAAFLGVDAEALFKKYPNLFGKVKSQNFDYGIGTLEVRSNPGGGVKWIPNAAWIAAFAALFALAYFFAKFLEVI